MRDGLGRVQAVAVFGGGSDIGRALARRLVADGARAVVLAVREPARAAAAADELRAAGARVEVVGFDADAPEAHDAAVAEAARALGGDIDLAVLAFGVLGDQAQAERDPAAAAALVRTNAVGGVALLTALGDRLRRQGHGAIVVLSSVAAERPRRANFAYGASKAALDAFAQGLHDALAPAGVHVLVVRPGFVRTKMTAGLKAAPFATDPDAVARATLAGLDRGAHTVWVPGALRFLFAALRLLPRPLWARLRM